MRCHGPWNHNIPSNSHPDPGEMHPGSVSPAGRTRGQELKVLAIFYEGKHFWISFVSLFKTQVDRFGDFHNDISYKI